MNANEEDVNEEYEAVEVKAVIDNSLYPNRGLRKSARFKLDAWKLLLNWDDMWSCCASVADEDDDVDAEEDCCCCCWFATFDDMDADFEIVVFFKVVSDDDEGEFTKNGFDFLLFIFTFMYSFKWLSWKINVSIDVFCMPDTRPIERRRPLSIIKITIKKIGIRIYPFRSLQKSIFS